MQKKGGVGKSVISSILMQYLLLKGYFVKGFDTDPSNKSLSEFTALDVITLDILDDNKDIDSRKFDILIDVMSTFTLQKDCHIVIDTGSSCFVPLSSYLKQNNVFNLLKNDNEVYVHIPITGGSDIRHTVECFGEIAHDFPNIPLYIWLNDYHGDLIFENKPFEEFDIYQKYKNSIHSLIKLPSKNRATYGKDLEIIFTKKMTFKHSFKANLPLMVRHRLNIWWLELVQTLDEVACFPGPPENPQASEDPASFTESEPHVAPAATSERKEEDTSPDTPENLNNQPVTSSESSAAGSVPDSNSLTVQFVSNVK
jgi:hypothetical protein